MGAQTVQLGAALLSGSFLPSAAAWLWRRLRRDPKAEAEAGLLTAQASRLEWQTLRDEIDRLTSIVRDQGKQIAELKKAAEARADRETELENENRRLRFEVSSLRKRVAELEEVLKTKTTPEDMRAYLDEIERKTSGNGK